jgi:hypothetical protein
LRKLPNFNMKSNLIILDDSFTIHRLPSNSEIPNQVYQSRFYSISRSDEEMSIVCSSSVDLDSDRSETGWSCIKFIGPLDFSLAGVIADVSAVLARAKIGIFAISTFDTDYILVKSVELEAAKKVLKQAEYTFEN